MFTLVVDVGSAVSDFPVPVTSEEFYWPHKACQHLASSQQSVTQRTDCCQLLTAVHKEMESSVQMNILCSRSPCAPLTL